MSASRFREPMTKGKKEKPQGVFGEVAPYLTIGMQLGIGAVVFFLIGHWIDGKFGSSPWGTIGGLAIGIGGGFVKFFMDVAKLSKIADSSGKDENKE